ncbi:MAG: hypothetical protein Roseis2KO_27830 [Roseivirga sp.]
MKKAIIIGVILLVGAFFTFFDLSIDQTNKLEFLENYRTETGYSGYEAEQVFSTDNGESGLRITFYGCSIDTTNMKLFGSVSQNIAQQINIELNADNEFENIILIFKPKNKAGIRINEMMSIDELKFNHKTSELNN